MATATPSNESPPPAIPTGEAPTPTPTTPTATATAAATAKAPAPAPVGTDAASLEKSFAALDFNPDGTLDGLELQRCGCASADRDGNGEVSKAEYMAAGLLGKLPPPKQGPAPTPTQPKPPGPTPPTPPTPTPVAAGGLPLGTYKCFGLVGAAYVARGSFQILDGSRYQMPDGTGAGNYVFDAGTKKIRFTSGVYSDPNAVKEAWQESAIQISMRAGKDGFYRHDCKR